MSTNGEGEEVSILIFGFLFNEISKSIVPVLLIFVGMLIVEVFNLFVNNKFKTVSVPYNFPTKISSLKTAKPSISITGESLLLSDVML